MQIYAPVGRVVGNLRKQEAALQRHRIPESQEGSRGGRAVGFDGGALQTGGTLGPGSTGGESAERLSP